MKKKTLIKKPSFKVWKSIKIGTYKSTNELSRALKKNGLKTSKWVDHIFNKHDFKVASKEEEIQLVNVSVAELGFGAAYINYRSICAKAKDFGLELCQNEVGPQLRLQYKDQTVSERLRIATEPIMISYPKKSLFFVWHINSDFWLSEIDSDSFWSGDSRFIFCRRNPKI